MYSLSVEPVHPVLACQVANCIDFEWLSKVPSTSSEVLGDSQPHRRMMGHRQYPTLPENGMSFGVYIIPDRVK